LDAGTRSLYPGGLSLLVAGAGGAASGYSTRAFSAALPSRLFGLPLNKTPLLLAVPLFVFMGA